jgi:hypothetical protein
MSNCFTIKVRFSYPASFPLPARLRAGGRAGEEIEVWRPGGRRIQFA